MRACYYYIFKMENKKECEKCGSTNTYFTKKLKFCRACGHEELREVKDESID